MARSDMRLRLTQKLSFLPTTGVGGAAELIDRLRLRIHAQIDHMHNGAGNSLLDMGFMEFPFILHIYAFNGDDTMCGWIAF